MQTSAASLHVAAQLGPPSSTVMSDACSCSRDVDQPDVPIPAKLSIDPVGCSLNSSVACSAAATATFSQIWSKHNTVASPKATMYLILSDSVGRLIAYCMLRVCLYTSPSSNLAADCGGDHGGRECCANLSPGSRKHWLVHFGFECALAVQPVLTVLLTVLLCCIYCLHRRPICEGVGFATGSLPSQCIAAGEQQVGPHMLPLTSTHSSVLRSGALQQQLYSPKRA